jgi:glycosyltransferase involved in cell wall biosynthesis
MQNKISIINFSAALVQEDAIEGGNKGTKYYSTQKGALIQHLTLKFPEVSIDVIGLNTDLSLKIQDYNKFRITRLPHIHPITISAILFNFSSFLYLLIVSRPKLIYVYTDETPIHSVGALIYAKLARKPFFINLRNPPSSLCSFEDLSVFKQILAKILDKLIFKNSDKIIHISDKSKESLKQHPKLYRKSVVMQSCPNNIFQKYSQIKDIKNNQLSFAYWGIMDRTRDLDIVIKGFAKAKELNDGFEAKFYLFGGGRDLDGLKEVVKKLKIPDIIFKGYMGQKELCKFIQDISVAVIPIPPSDYFQYSSPLKLAEAVTMELPMIASSIEPNKIVKEQNLGILCEHDVDSYAQAFLKFWNFSNSEINEFGENCKKVKCLFTPENVFKEVMGAIANEIQPRKR